MFSSVPSGKSFAKNFSHCDHSKLRGLAKIEILARNQTERQTRHAEDRGLQGAGHCAGISGIVAEIAAVVDSGSADVRHVRLQEESCSGRGSRNRSACRRRSNVGHRSGECAAVARESDCGTRRSFPTRERRRKRRRLPSAPFKLDRAIRMDAVVVCQQNSRHTKLTLSAGFACTTSVRLDHSRASDFDARL